MNEYKAAIKNLTNSLETAEEINAMHGMPKDTAHTNALRLAINALNEYIAIHETPFLPTEEAFFKKVEKALGFKLYVWQKTYISSIGHFRRTGETTAICLKELLKTDAPPIDFSNIPSNKREDCERYQFREIQNKLIAAGIPTRTVFWNKREKERYKVQHRYELIADGKEIKAAILDELAANQKPLFLFKEVEK